MAFTERYVTDAASGGGVGSEGDPWTLAEGLAAVASGERLNVQSDGAYTIGADTVTNAGTIFDPIVIRGYNSAIGDLEGASRSATTGKLVTTNWPAITVTGALNPNAYVIFQNLNITGSLSTFLLGHGSTDSVTYVEVSVVNAQNNAAARAIQGDHYCLVINCDFECSGAAHATVADFSAYARVISCRIQAVAGDAINLFYGTVIDNLLIGNATDIAVKFDSSRTLLMVVHGNTIYNWAKAIEFPNAAMATYWPSITNNHVTDCAEYIDDLYVATDSGPVIEVFNRTRDNVTPRTGVGDGVNAGEVTTDTGGVETDFTNAGSGDYSLISGAPAEDAGMGFGAADIGAWVHAVGGGGSASGVRNPMQGPIG